jgi:hypothetical protein
MHLWQPQGVPWMMQAALQSNPAQNIEKWLENSRIPNEFDDFFPVSH